MDKRVLYSFLVLLGIAAVITLALHTTADKRIPGTAPAGIDPTQPMTETALGPEENGAAPGGTENGGKVQDAAGGAKPGTTGAQSTAPPLPPLIADSPLDDARFTAISAELVVAAMGFPEDDEWDSKMVEFMRQLLKKEGISALEYEEYSEALGRYPDRARAVAEAVITQAEKKIGHSVDLEAMPLLRLDTEALEEAERKLSR